MTKPFDPFDESDAEAVIDVLGPRYWAVIAQYYTSEPQTNPFPGTAYPRLMAVYQAEDQDEAFQKFEGEFLPDPTRAQVFFNDITIMELASSEYYEIKLKDRYGDLAKFPNPKVCQKYNRFRKKK